MQSNAIMTPKNWSYRPLLAASLLSSACIIAGPIDDDAGAGAGSYTTSGSYVPTTSGFASDTAAPATTGGAGEAETGGADDDGGETDEWMCGDSVIDDGGFEAAIDESPWTVGSLGFGTPLCDESCSEDEGAEPYAGEQFVWFGGTDDIEEAYVQQSVTIAPSETARLAFYLAIDSQTAAGDDWFRVWLDDELVFEANDADVGTYENYTRIELDVGSFADGEPHSLSFEAILTEGNLSNFFLDEVELSGCEAVDDGTSSGTGSDSSTTSEGSTTGAADDGTSTGTTAAPETGTGTGGFTSSTGGSSETGA